MKNKPIIIEGDLIGFSGQGWISDLINLGSFGIPRWGLSHMGIACTINGKMYIFESTTLNGDKKCAVTGSTTSGVQAHPIEDIYTRPGKVWLYEIQQDPDYCVLRKVLKLRLGVPYDYHGAAHAGGFLLRWLGKILHRQDISTLFCSELVALALTEAGVTRIMNASGESPNSLVRRLRRSKVISKRTRLK